MAPRTGAVRRTAVRVGVRILLAVRYTMSEPTVDCAGRALFRTGLWASHQPPSETCKF